MHAGHIEEFDVEIMTDGPVRFPLFDRLVDRFFECAKDVFDFIELIKPDRLVMHQIIELFQEAKDFRGLLEMIEEDFKKMLELRDAIHVIVSARKIDRQLHELAFP